ncbi:hypothetical protein [Croceiramulus getboli]|nr:hypothetical protein P8624_13595 [Flavobacteriaceae bacterium YJPT1-3]
MTKLLLLIFTICSLSVSAQVGIGTTAPSDAAILDVRSSSDGIAYRGFLPPRATTQMALDDIAARATPDDIGLLIFHNDMISGQQCLKVWNGANWENIYCLTNSTNPTSVEFSNGTGFAISENGGVVDLDFLISDPSLTNPVTLTIETNDYSDFNEAGAQQVIIPAGNTTYTAASVFTVLDDVLIEGTELITLTITTISGGDGTPTIGNLNTEEVSIVDDDIELWINEIHYDNFPTADLNERVEIAGTAGMDLNGYRIIHYNGTGGTIISTTALSGIIPDQQAGLGTLNVPISPLQNGPAEGLALVDPADQVVQFLSYEGVITATTGPAIGLTSIDIGVNQDPPTAAGTSLQLQGTGNQYADFTWSANIPDTIGTINNGQTFN